MNRNEVMGVLKSFLEKNGERYGIIALGVFGSVAKGTASEASDVDVVIQLKQSNLLILSRIRIELEEQIKHHVDMVSYRERMNPFLKHRIEEEACYV